MWVIDFRFEIQCPPYDYTIVRKALNLSTLVDHRIIANKNFLFKLLSSSENDSPSLFSQSNFRIPSHHNSLDATIYIPFSTSNCHLNSPLCSIIILKIITPPLHLNYIYKISQPYFWYSFITFFQSFSEYTC